MKDDLESDFLKSHDFPVSPSLISQRKTDQQLLTLRTRMHNLGKADSIVLNGKHYTIVDIICGNDKSGEAVIYKIRNIEQEVFALKLYYQFKDPDDEPKEEALNRIMRINDESILPLYDYGTGSNKYNNMFCFEISKYADGGDLLSISDHKMKYKPEFVETFIVPRIFQAIQVFHENSIYHCNLKPQNVFYLDAEQTDCVIGDYGSAKTLENEAEGDLRKISRVISTDFYMSSEQAQGVISPANDYYSFGMILLHLLYPEKVTTANQSRIIEKQVKGKEIIEYSNDLEYNRLNRLIAGLTLRDHNDRWGGSEVNAWMRGEYVHVMYSHLRHIKPIKLHNATIYGDIELINYMETDEHWYQTLIEDIQGYNTLLSWISSLENINRKMVFDRMIRYYKDFGARYVKLVITKYFDPYKNIIIGQHVFNISEQISLEDFGKQFFKHLDNMWKSTQIDDLKFYFFQLEFTLYRLSESAILNRSAKSFLRNISATIGEEFKEDFSDFIAVMFSNIIDSKLIKLFYAYNTERVFRDKTNNDLETIEEIGFYFIRNEQYFDDNYLSLERKMFLLKIKLPELINLRYSEFVFTIFKEHIKYAIDIKEFNFNLPRYVNITYEFGKSLVDFLRTSYINQNLCKMDLQQYSIEVKKRRRSKFDTVYDEFSDKLVRIHNIEKHLIDAKVEENLNREYENEYNEYRAQRIKDILVRPLVNLLPGLISILKSLFFLLPLLYLFILFSAYVYERQDVMQLIYVMQSIAVFPIINGEEMVDSAFVNLSLYRLHLLLFLFMIPTLIINRMEKTRDSIFAKRIFIFMAIFLVFTPLFINVMYKVILILASVVKSHYQYLDFNKIQIIYVLKWIYVIGTNFLIILYIIGVFRLRKFKAYSFMLSCCPYIYLAIILAQGDGSSNGYIVGSVTDATTNQSINNARVVLRYKEFGINKDETRTNEVGKYQIQNVSLGKYSINIITDGYSTLQREITMFSDSLITEDFTLERIESKLGTGTSDIVENGKSPKRPIIMVSVDLIDFGSDKKNLEISIKRVGGDEILGWKVVYNPTWVVVNPMNGENDGEEDKIRVEAKRGNEFSYGQLSDVITIRSNGGDKFILVKMLNTTYNPKLYNPTEITDNSMLLTWDTLNYPEFAEYRLYRSKQPGVDETSVLVFTSSACTETRYKDNNLDASTTYYYMLSTSNSSNVTAVSNIVSNTTARRLGIWRKMSEFKNMEIITDFHIVNRNSIYLIGGNIYGKVFHWNGSQIKHIQTPDLSYGSWHFTDITADNNNNMWLVTTYETVVNGRNVSVLKFDGNDWKWIENIPVRRYYSVVSTDANDIWIGGENGIVVRYNNSFIQSNKLTNKSCCIIDIYAVGNENLYCLSDDGIVWHYSVHGWERIEIPGYDPDTKPAECITGTASGNLWIGGSGEIRHFDGISWQLVYGNGSNDKVKCLRAISKNNIWAGGEFHIDGIDVNSINFDGKLWCPVKSELSYPICRMKIYAENPWAIDEQGNLLKYVVDN